MISTLEQYIEAFRGDEVRYRKEGQFESAVQSQRAADYLETCKQGSETLLDKCMPAWFDRGIDRQPYYCELNGLLGIYMVNGTTYFMTKDTQEIVLTLLVSSLQLTPHQLLELCYESPLGESP